MNTPTCKPTSHKPLLYPDDCDRMDKAAIWSAYEMDRDRLLTELQALRAEAHPKDTSTTVYNPYAGGPMPGKSKAANP
jgi:hypothetical protein